MITVDMWAHFDKAFCLAVKVQIDLIVTGGPEEEFRSAVTEVMGP
jgi:hypothetical protein